MENVKFFQTSKTVKFIIANLPISFKVEIVILDTAIFVRIAITPAMIELDVFQKFHIANNIQTKNASLVSKAII